MPGPPQIRSQLHFHCRGCGFRFEAAPGRVVDAPELEHHPFEYFARCDGCGDEAPQAAWERALLKAWTRATGPRTEAGKAAAARNLEGHPTAEEAVRTRFNALKHGLYARTATYFPARPGQYPHCEGCELRYTVCPTQTACLKRTELFLKHHIAFETRDPELLTELRADTQAAVQAIINDMILAISADGGPRIKSVEWYYDKEGGFHLARWRDQDGNEQQIYKLEAHPLLKPLIDFLAKNAMTLADMEMTPKSRDEQEALQGFLDGRQQATQGALDYQRRQAEAIEDLRGLIHASQEKTRRDPVLIEHGNEQSDG